MILKKSWARAVLCLVLCSDIARAGVPAPVRRADGTFTNTDVATTTEAASSQQSTTIAQTTSDERQTTSSVSTSITNTPSTSSTATTAIPSALNGNTISNVSSIFGNSTIEDGELPLEPRLTPGWGVAGVILLISGVVYALIGIKNNWLHTFVSVAYLAGLCTAVLIVYVMAMPVSDGTQGAYVVACVCAGVVLGGGATFLKEITEGLGCLLGGFCFSMWLLSLRDGGLLTNSTEKIIFITIFTFAGFALYFSRYTRGYALIWSISFSGATAAVLGIDCFSRAGYKEFWAYIWGLNENLFPLGATTYPITKGIRVEIALTVLICLVGIVSQLKLWRVIQAHRSKRADARAEAQRQREIEEANVGKEIEAQDARERHQWEASYGEKTRASVGDSSKGSGSATINEKKGRYSQTTVQQIPDDEGDVVEMADLTPSQRSPIATGDEFVDIDLTNADTGRRAVRVAEDDNAAHSGPPSSTNTDKVWVVGADGEARPRSIVSPRNSQRLSRSSAPEITPLPFKIPDEIGTEHDDDDRSSFATFADDDDRSIRLSKRESRASLGHRLSLRSGHLLRTLSKGSARSTRSKRKTIEMSPTGLSHAWNESKEDLVPDPRSHDDTGSVAATADRLSMDNDEQDLKSERPSFAMEITAELNDIASQHGSAVHEKSSQPSRSPTFGQFLRPQHYSTAETVDTDILGVSSTVEPTGANSNRNSSDSTRAKTENASEHGQAVDAKTATPRMTASPAPSVSSTPASLTKDRLPAGLSRVASAYRTNEWAKHLSQADLPETEKLRLSQHLPDAVVANDIEIAAPVKLAELQQTAVNGAPPPAVTRSSSGESQAIPASGPVSRSNSRVSLAQENGLYISNSSNIDATSRNSTIKTSAPPSVHATRGYQRRSTSAGQRPADNVGPISEEQSSIIYSEPRNLEEGLESGQASPAVPDYVQQPAQRASSLGIVSYASPQTLLGKRELLLRNKSSILSTTQGDSRNFTPTGSDAGSIYNYPSYNSPVGQDLDDMPLSQRRQLIRQSSNLSAGGVAGSSRPTSQVPYGASQTMAETLGFDSHQPQRHSKLPSHQAREAQLASFRNSLALDVRGARDSLPSQMTSSNHIERNLEQSRSKLLSQREQETQRREMERLQKERNDRAFEESMRSNPNLIDAHRDAMRRLQRAAR